MKLTHDNRKTRELEVLLLNDERFESGSVGVFDLPAGYTCPAAKDCLTRAERNPERDCWEVVDYGKFRCYAASQEALYPSVRKLRWKNYNDIMNSRNLIADLCTMVEFSPHKYIRLHSSGDFFNMRYYKAWLQVAEKFPNRIFYGYTKVDWLLDEEWRTDNFRFNLSLGGLNDNKFLNQSWLPVTGVAIDPKAEYPHPLITGALTEIAVLERKSFYIPIHGTQPAGSRESKAVSFWKRVQKRK
jgi:hypothetical protein